MKDKRLEDRQRTGGRAEMLVKDTGGTCDGGILVMAEGQLLCNLMRSYKLKRLHLNIFNINCIFPQRWTNTTN